MCKTGTGQQVATTFENSRARGSKQSATTKIHDTKRHLKFAGLDSISDYISGPFFFFFSVLGTADANFTYIFLEPLSFAVPRQVPFSPRPLEGSAFPSKNLAY
jgi:hypothetical protein